MAKHADLRFYAELRDFLSTDRKYGMVTRSFDVPGSVKDLIEACGVPHVEVDVILANGAAVDFAYRVGDGDRISVYPPFRRFEIEPPIRLSPPPPAVFRFVVDGHLGKLARCVRLLGFDTAYDVVWDDPRLVEISVAEERILLTRDIGLLMHGVLTRGYFVRAIDPDEQLAEVSARFGLAVAADPFTRCMECNGLLRPVDRSAVAHRVPPRSLAAFDDFHECPDCRRAYWEGSHIARLREIVDRVMSADSGAGAQPPGSHDE